MNEFQNLLQKHTLTLEQVAKSQETVQNELRKGQMHIQEQLKLGVKELQTNQSAHSEKIKENLKEEFKDELNKIFEEQNRRPILFHKMRTRLKNNRFQFFSIGVLVFLPILLFYIGMYSRLSTKQPNNIAQTVACVSEEYSVPFSQDLPLLGYLYEHKALTGRNWLMEDVKHELISPDSNQLNGIVLIAEMGYGKSAFVSNLLCPGSNKLAVSIQKHIVAFHICKFDVRSTLSIERFIRRLVGFLAMKSAEYGNIISMLPETSILYNRDSCEKEPEACFDQGISIPVKQLKDVIDVPWVIVIDALDECASYGKNQLLELLASRIHQLPKWLKFLLTSRNMTSLTMLRKMKFEYLLSYDPRNKKDIKEFIKETFPSTHNPQIVARLIDRSEGSFVYVIQALKWIADRGEANIPKFPSELSDIYEINFDRQFKAAFSYIIPKTILEITCSAINPLSSTDIYIILKSSNNSLTTGDFETFINSLSFFLKVDDNVRVSHQALYYWLISEKNTNYRISLQAGHVLFSKYLFSTVGGNNSKDIVELAIHVANSEDPTLRKMFVSSPALNSNEHNYRSLPHKLIWKTPSVSTLELLLNHYPDVNIINEGNVTPAFVAAAKGHIDQLALLHRKGAQLDFTVKGNILISPYSVFVKIEMMKNQYYSGYSLLHIAAQHGHTSVIKYILNHNKTLLYLENAMGLHAGHVACERGHVDVIKYLYNVDPKLFDDRCMFYASKQNHITILKWLTQKGITFKCISDAMSESKEGPIEYLTEEIMTENTFVYFPDDIMLWLYVNPSDDNWIVLKIDPLNIAIRYGSLDAATFLIENFPEALQCHDAFGFTAALASIVYNRTELLPLLTSNLVTDKCAKIPEHVQRSETFKTIQLFEKALGCPEGASFAHLVALYSLNEMLLYSLKSKVDINWNEQDSFGNFPIHYAVANNNIIFLILFEKGKLEYKDKISYKETQALNGSTVYHVAAISGQYLSTFLLMNKLKAPIPDLKDNDDRHVTHYIVSREFHGIAYLVNESQTLFLDVFRYLIEVSKHKIRSLDRFGRNVLHHALRNGHYLIVNYLHTKTKNIFDSMLSQKDHDGFTPIHFAIRSYDRSNLPLGIPFKCAFYDVFLDSCSESKNFLMLMSPWEIGLLNLIQTASTANYYKYLEPNIKYILEKSTYLSTAILFYHEYVDTNILKRSLVSIGRYNITFMTHLAIARHKPMAFISCHKPLLASPLHYIILTMDHKDTVFRLHHYDVDLFLSWLYFNDSFKFDCSDENGYNIFHYSLIGGNIQTAKILMRKNITMNDNNVSFTDVFLMAMSSRQREDRKNYIECSDDGSKQNQQYCTDIFLFEYFEKNKSSFTSNDICKNGSKELSLVHILSVNCMANAMKAISEEFGSTILNCPNMDHFTPHYFGKLFCTDSFVSLVFNNTEHQSVELPYIQAEEWLMWSMLQNFPQVNISDDLFYLPPPSIRLSYRQIIRGQIYVKRVLLQSLTFSDSSSCKILTTFIAVSLELPKLVYCNQFFEYIHFSRDDASITCGPNLSKITKCFLWLTQMQEFLDSNYFLHKLFSKMPQKKTPAFRQSIQSLNDIVERCDEKSDSIVIEKRKFINLILHFKRMCTVLNQMLVEAAIFYYIQGRKSMRVIIPSSYNFMHLRMKKLKFKIDEKDTKFGAFVPIVAMNRDSLYEYKHIASIKPQLAYKYFRNSLLVDEYGISTVSDFDFFERFTMLKDPFSDLEGSV